MKVGWLVGRMKVGWVDWLIFKLFGWTVYFFVSSASRFVGLVGRCVALFAWLVGLLAWLDVVLFYFLSRLVCWISLVIM